LAQGVPFASNVFFSLNMTLLQNTDGWSLNDKKRQLQQAPLQPEQQLPKQHSYPALEWAWSQRWLLTAGWWVCAVFAVQAVKHATAKNMLGVFCNLLIGGPLLVPFAVYQGIGPFRTHWRQLLLLGLLNGLEINLGNSSLYTVGASLKTAMGGFNVVATFFAAALLGANPADHDCLLGCKCHNHGFLGLAIAMLAGGCILTALMGTEQNWGASLPGMLLQLSSSVFYALRYTAVKLLLNGSPDSPSKLQTAAVVSPVTGLVALCCIPFFEGGWQVPEIQDIAVLSLSIIGILMFELRLVELTSPLTVSVLAIMHNVVIVLFFALFQHDVLSNLQYVGFAVSICGSLCYAMAKLWTAPEAPSQSSEVNGSEDPEDSTEVPGENENSRRGRLADSQVSLLLRFCTE